MRAKHRIPALLLAVALLTAAFTIPAAAKGSFLLGDLNGDGQRTAIDYILLKRHILGTYRMPDSALPAADINGNGKPDALDYLLLKRSLMGTFVLPDAPQEPAEPPAELRYAVAFTYLFRTENHEYLLQLEAELGVEPETLNQLVVSYLATLSIDGDELLALEDQFPLPTPEEIDAFLHTLAAWLETLLPANP